MAESARYVSLQPRLRRAKYGGMSQRVVIVLFDGFQLLDLAGPVDVFSAAGLLNPSADYRVEVTAVQAGAVRSCPASPWSLRRRCEV